MSKNIQIMVIVIGDKLDTAYLVLSTYLLTYFITNINIHIFWVIIVRREMYPQYTDTPPDLDHLQLFPPPFGLYDLHISSQKNELIPIFQFLKKIVCQRSLVSYCNQWNRVSYFTKKNYSIPNQFSTLSTPIPIPNSQQTPL